MAPCWSHTQTHPHLACDQEGRQLETPDTMGQPWQMQDVFPTEAGLKDGETPGREKRLGEKEGSGTGSAFTDEKQHSSDPTDWTH